MCIYGTYYPSSDRKIYIYRSNQYHFHFVFMFCSVEMRLDRI